MKTVLALCFITFTLIHQTMACSCKVTERTMIESYNAAGVIFAGEILKIKRNRFDIVATFRVDIPLKNSRTNDTILITTYDYGCGIDFQHGEAWKIWAYKSGEEFNTNICTSSHKYIIGNEPSYFDTLASYKNFTGKKEWKYDSNIIGAQGKVKNGLAEGKWTYFHPTGEIRSIGFYKNGAKEGLWKYYHNPELLAFFHDSSLRSEYEKTGVMGKGNSLKKRIDKTSDLEKILLYQIEEYKEGEFHGQVSYYRLGEKTESSTYQNGVKHGEQLYFNEKGEISSTVIFENGSPKQ